MPPRELDLPGLLLLQPSHFEDARGSFTKTFHAPSLAEERLAFDLREEFITVSHRNVLRGMHFQVPPAAHRKLVTCVRGAVLDVLLDLRPGPHYGRSTALELTASNRYLLWIPKGIAHGFLALEDHSTLVYKTDHAYAPEHDKGIAWNSFGFPWPVEQPILSERDRNHPPLPDTPETDWKGCD